MSDVCQQVWFWLIIAYIILELSSNIFIRECWVVMIITKFLEIIKHTIIEVKTKKARERLCGMLLTLCFLLTLLPFIHGLSVAFTSADATTIIYKSEVMGFTLVGATIITYIANRIFVVQG